MENWDDSDQGTQLSYEEWLAQHPTQDTSFEDTADSERLHDVYLMKEAELVKQRESDLSETKNEKILKEQK